MTITTLLDRAARQSELGGMDQARPIETLEIVGGHISLDFANTVGDRLGDTKERLESLGDFCIWAVRCGLLTEAQAALVRDRSDGGFLPRAMALREAIYRIFAALATGAPPPAADLALLGTAAAHAASLRKLRLMQGAFAWCWPEAMPLERLAFAAAELLTGADLRRLKMCQGARCGWLFLDTTRNNSRCWCSDGECGTLARVTRFRARRRGLSSGAA